MTELPAVLLLLGVILLLVGLVGRVKVRDMEVGAENKIVRYLIGSIGVTFITLALFLVLLPFSWAPMGTFFSNPVMDNYRVDWCYDSIKACGQMPADEFCRRQGLVRAVGFTQDPDVGKDGIVTRKLGTGELCSNTTCDAYKSITCR